MPDLKPKQQVRVRPMPGTKNWWPATVVKSYRPQSFVVESRVNGQLFRRNRRHIRQSTATANENTLREPEVMEDDQLSHCTDTHLEEPGEKPMIHYK